MAGVDLQRVFEVLCDERLAAATQMDLLHGGKDRIELLDHSPVELDRPPPSLGEVWTPQALQLAGRGVFQLDAARRAAKHRGPIAIGLVDQLSVSRLGVERPLPDTRRVRPPMWLRSSASIAMSASPASAISTCPEATRQTRLVMGHETQVEVVGSGTEELGIDLGAVAEPGTPPSPPRSNSVKGEGRPVAPVIDRGRRRAAHCRPMKGTLPRLATVAALATLAPPLAAETPSADPPRRPRADELTCPAGAERRAGPARRGGGNALWCEIPTPSGAVRHGPYLELAADGTVARHGRYEHGLQVGDWLVWGPTGELLSSTTVWAGEAGPHLADPEELCPPGSRRVRSYGYDPEERMWSKCLRRADDGSLVQVGPRVTWSIDRQAEVVRYSLRDVIEYEDDQPHGRHRVYAGESGHEVLMLEESFVHGKLEGESHAFYEDGSLREVRTLRQGRLEGESRAYTPDGAVRWVATFDRGRPVKAEGDLTVGGQPCPEGTLPVATSDGLEEACERRSHRLGHRHGPFLLRDAEGRIVERGRYHEGRKATGPAADPAVTERYLVARGPLLVGERPLGEVTVAEPEIWVRNLDTREYPRPERKIDAGELFVSGLEPGRYTMGIVVDADPTNPERHPGDLTGSHEFDVVAGEVTALDLRLKETLRLTAPWDNAEPIPGWSSPCWDRPLIGSPIRFAWQAPASGRPGWTEYRYKVRRVTCDPYVEGEAVAEATTFDTSVSLDLPPTGRGELYVFDLIALEADIPIAHLMTFAGNGYGWDLRFRVGSPPAATVEPPAREPEAPSERQRR